MTARLVALAAVLSVGVLIRAAAPGPKAKYDGWDVPEPGSFAPAETLNCQGCHNEFKPENNPLYRATRSFEFVRLYENRVWGVHDLHSQAFKNLGSKPTDLGQRMQAVLREARNDPKYDVRKDAACLACHLTDARPETPAAEKTWQTILGGDGNEAESLAAAAAEGVGCEMCHGPASKWTDPHKSVRRVGARQVVPWREWPPEMKAKFGLVDLRDPAVAAAKCASCHIGDRAAGRAVTHEMYAAGHPPLPPVDIVAYARELPRHWGLPREMPFLANMAKSDPARAWALYHYRSETGPDGELYGVRRSAVAAVATLRASAELFREEAADALKHGGGLDFAAFDCYACHHDLRVPSDRQRRGYAGPPGRPTFRAAPLAPARLILRHAATLPDGGPLGEALADLGKATDRLTAAFASRTLGAPAEVQEAAKSLVAVCDRALRGLAAVRYTRPAAVGLLRDVIAAGAGDKTPVADPEVAQLLVWMVRTLRDELALDKDTPEPPGLAPLVTELEATVAARLRPNLETPAPPAPADGEYDDLREKSLVAVEERVGDRMKRLNGFDGERFRDVCRRIEPLAAGMK